MNTILNDKGARQPQRELTAKRYPSKLDAFTEPLLQMDDESKTIHQMVAWLKT
jgi:hypothetical protein